MSVTLYILLLLLLLTATELSLGGSRPYTSTDSCHSVAVDLTLVQAKQINNNNKRTNTKTQYKQYKTQLTLRRLTTYTG
jgi:hypothetical protein